MEDDVSQYETEDGKEPARTELGKGAAVLGPSPASSKLICWPAQAKRPRKAI
jgi:hypothetical protein